jgi:translation initiation factor 2 subunit 1
MADVKSAPVAEAAAAASASSADFVDDEAVKEERGRKVRELLFRYTCRFYPKVKPAEEDFCMVKVSPAAESNVSVSQPHVVCQRSSARKCMSVCVVVSWCALQVRRVAEMGAYVDLVEYEDREGMVLLSELSRRRIRSIKKLIGEGRMEVCMVIRVNDGAGYIDLSKRRVDKVDKEAYEDRYNRAVIVHNAMRTVVKDTFDPAAHADDFNPLESLCERLAWKLYEEYDHAHTGLRAIAKDPSLLEKYDLNEAEKASLLQQLAKKNKAATVKVRTDIHMTCFNYEGVLAIRDAVDKAEATSTDDHAIVVTTVAPPIYSISSATADIAAGIEALKTATAAAKKAIESYGGELSVVLEPCTAAAEEA